MSRILTVDDEQGIREFLADALAEDGHTVVQAADASEALDLLDDQPFDLAIVDLRMPGDLGGMDVVRRARGRWPDMQLIVLTAHGSVGEAVEAMRLGAFDFLEKPIAGPVELRRLARRAINWRGTSRRTAPEEAALAAAPRGRVAHLLWQLKRRHVYNVAATYAAAAFILLQGVELLMPALPELPAWAYPTLVFVVVAGFPVAIAFGWVYDTTASGLRRTAPDSTDER